MNIPVDKQLHFLGGWALSASLLPAGAVPALVVVTLVAAAKEWWDSTGRGTPEWADFLATALGGVFGVGAATAVQLLLVRAI